MDADLVVFDKDGTLIDIHFYWVGMLELRSKLLAKRYIKPDEKKQVTNELMFSMGVNLDTWKIKSNGPVGIKSRQYLINNAYKVINKYSKKISIDQVSSTFKEINLYSEKHLNQLVKPLPGAIELLKVLKSKKIKMAIATTDITSRAKLAMDHMQMSQYFELIAGGDLVMKPKPSPDLVNYICKELECKKNKTFVVGDSIVDLQMADAAEVSFIGVKTGLFSTEFLKNSKVLVDDLNILKKLL